MKQITLIRHAKVSIDNITKIDALALKKWIELYDTAPISKESIPPIETLTLAQNADIVLTSRLKRAKDSAKILGVKVYEENELFNEAAIPEVNIPFLKFRPKVWLIILRVMLFVGLGKKETSLKVSKTQANKAAKRLSLLSKKYEQITLVGHGGMNWLIYQELLKRGWKLEGRASHKNWGTIVIKK